MTDEFIENILQGLVSAGALQEIEHVDEATWLLMFDDDTGVGVECRGRGDELVLLTTLGRAPVDRRFTVYETALRFNALWRSQEGTRITLDAPDSELVLEHLLTARDWTQAEFEQELAKFRETARQWQSYVEQEPDNFAAYLPFQLSLRA